MNVMTQITTNIIVPKNTKPTTAGTANSSNKKENVLKSYNFILTCYYSGSTSNITIFNKWVAISSTEI